MDRIGRLVVEHDLLNLDQSELDQLKPGDSDWRASLLGDARAALYRRSLYRVDQTLYAIVRLRSDGVVTSSVTGPAGAGSIRKRLVAFSAAPVTSGFYGARGQVGTLHYQEIVPASMNLGPLFELFPWTKPVSLREKRTTIGMGDRIGLATAGQIQAARAFNLSPVLAQQSIRELDFTARSFADVVSDAAFLVFQEGFESGYGADGDHLKTIPDIDRAVAQHMPMITLDLTEVMRPEVAEMSDAEVEDVFASVPSDFAARVQDEYAGRTFELDTSRIELSAEEARRCAVMYGPALLFSEKVNDHLDRRTGGAYDLEISIDETTTPTLPAHHFFVARELHRRGVVVSSVAPRFIGEFQKAIDYIGDLAEFERQFRVHAEIARVNGSYKISVHSGSDKFSAYPIIGRETKYRLHLKTSGTSWLESLRTIAQCKPDVYRLIHQRAFEYFPEALKSYHISANPDAIAPLDSVADGDLPSFLEDVNCRQLLHISYGGLLGDSEVREVYFAALHEEEAMHSKNVEKHLNHHMAELGIDRA